jgi:hypothetical protein
VATFANYTSYLLGINGIMVDIAGLAVPGDLGAAQFEFRVGNTEDPSSWSVGPAPGSITVRAGAGVGGSDRVTLIWPDRAIRGQWLQVTVRADAVTGLLRDDIFYFGNAPGESGNSATNTFVDGTDFAAARDHFRSFLNRAPIYFPFDYNRDSLVDGSDMAVARDYTTNFLPALKRLDLSAAGGPLADFGEGGSAVERQPVRAAGDDGRIATDVGGRAAFSLPEPRGGDAPLDSELAQAVQVERRRTCTCTPLVVGHRLSAANQTGPTDSNVRPALGHWLPAAGFHGEPDRRVHGIAPVPVRFREAAVPGLSWDSVGARVTSLDEFAEDVDRVFADDWSVDPLPEDLLAERE